MVTTRQVTRGVFRTMRAMDRAAKQSERQRVARQQALHRQSQLDASARAAAEHEEIVAALAMEFLSTLPLDEVEVLMLTDILDRGSGHIEALPVLYLRASAQALQSLNLTRTEATPLVERLGGHMEWSRKDGFRAINPAAFGIELEG